MATVAQNVDVLDKMFKTFDGRFLNVYYDSFIGGLELRLGQTTRIRFSDSEFDKCRRMVKKLVKQLDAVEVFKTSEGWQ